MGDEGRFDDSKKRFEEGKESTSDEKPEHESAAPKKLQIDPVRFRMFQQQIKDKQNFSMGILAGFIAGSVGAALWGLISYFSSYQIGFMSIGVGFLVGIAIRKFGAGMDVKFGIAGAILSLYGCLAGNIFMVALAVSREYNVPLSEIMSQMNFETMWIFLKAGFEPMDVLFYGIALYFGYKYSFRRIKQEELEKLVIR
ncbi:MAG TPA: hypothetical protein ENO22_13570 [candidate division Zixibacteria bacterium]|nr:hypothetical protein [candidate division Zixibacteria bacterium]HER00364.1 hypothetical protein [candidate division Zixibacteria bacterium]